MRLPVADSGGRVRSIDRIWRQIAHRLEGLRISKGRAFLVGICGPQGSGKSTGAAVLHRLLEERGFRIAVTSLDDFYLTRAERLDLQRDVHPLLGTRGPPGTHDLQLGMETTARLLAGESFPIPTFAKHLDDRAEPATWPWFQGPADIVLLEGWCIGARPQAEETLREPVNDLERNLDNKEEWRRFVNSALRRYQDWFDGIDYLIQLRPPSFAVVARWRLEQEEALRARLDQKFAEKLMSAQQVEQFVQHYERITVALMRDGPARAGAVINLDENRRPQCVSA